MVYILHADTVAADIVPYGEHTAHYAAVIVGECGTVVAYLVRGPVVIEVADI